MIHLFLRIQHVVYNMTTKTQHRPRYYTRPAFMDPINSVDVFEYDRVNEFGRPYCVVAAILPEQAQRLVLGIETPEGELVAEEA